MNEKISSIMKYYKLCSKLNVSFDDLLNDDFVQTYRSCIINKTRACKIDFTKKKGNIKGTDLDIISKAFFAIMVLIAKVEE